MADTFSSAILGLGVDTKQFNKDIDNTGASVEKALERMKLSADAFSDKWGDMTAGIKDTKRIVSGILVSQGFYALSNTLLNAGAAALSFSQNMETAAISMEYFVTGADKVAKAQAYLRSMNTFAAKTPFSTEEALSLSKYMQAVGVSMGTTKSFLSVITDTAAATGATNENLQRIVFGLGQMMTKGRLANEEIRQLANANIPIYEILQEQLGLTGKQISNIGSYWIDADKAVVAILNGLETRYAGAADRISNTMTGMLDTLKDDAKIITQIAGAGMYDVLAGTMTNLRDTLDRYREIATEKGSMGLFDQILRDMDATGQLGTQILALIGNTRQLGAAFRELYISGRPVIDLIGKSLYASITVAEITLTSFAQVANSVVKGLDKLGLTSGTTAEVLASLFIAYKAAKWMAFLGQGAAAAAYGMYQSVTAASAMLPASLQASAGVKLLTTGLIGLITYGLTAYGIFKMLNNSFAGLETTTSGSNLFPDDYSSAFKKYQEEMDAYNAKIAAYQEDYTTPYTEIADGADAANAGLESVADTSKKTAASVKNDWTAAFDEVYTIPDQTSGAADAAALKDLGALLQSPSFTFPDLSGLGDELVAPEFPWNDVFKGGLLDSDVLDGDWWKTLLPMVLMGAAGYLGDTLAKNMGKNGPSGKGGDSGSADSSPFQSAKDATGVLKNLSKEFTKVEQGVKDIGEKLKEGKFASVEEQQGLYKLLEERLATANKLLDKINRQAIIAGKFDSHLESGVLKEFNNLSEIHKIADGVSRMGTLAEQAKETGLLGDGARKEISEIKKLLEKQYASYVGRNGASTPELDNLLTGIIDTKGLQGRIETLTKDIEGIKKTLEENGYKAGEISQAIKDTSKLGNGVLNELKSIGADTNSLIASLDTLGNIEKLLTQQTDLANKLLEVEKLKDLLKTAQARGLEGFKQSAMTDTIESLNKSIQNLNKSIDVQTALISHGTEEEATAFRVKQAIIEANNNFNNVTSGILDRYLSSTLKPMKALEVYTKRIMLNQIEGHNLIKNGISSTIDMTSRLTKPFEDSLKQFFVELKTSYEDIVKTGTVPKSFAADTQAKLLAAVKDMGMKLGASSETVDKYLEELSGNIKSIDGHAKDLDYLVQQAKEMRKQTKAVTAEPASRDILDVLDDKLSTLQESALTIKDFDKEVKSIRKFLEEKYPNATAKLESQITEQISVTRDMLVEKFSQLSGLQKLANSALYKITAHSEELSKLNQMVDQLEALNKTVVGAGTRKGWAFPEESAAAPFANAIKAGYIDAAIVKAGIFDPGRLALSGGDVAGLFGQSGYGVTTFSATLSNISAATKALFGLPKELNTLASIANMTFGAVAETPILVKTAELMQAKGYKLTLGDTFFDEQRKLQAQLDGLLWKNSKFIGTIDAKALASFSSKIKPLLEKSATYSEGIYKLNAKSFKDLINSTDDVAWQLAQQATIMGKNSAWLAVLDTKGAGISGPDYAALYKYNPTISKDVGIIKKLVEKQAAAQYTSRLDALKDNLYLIQVEIPKWAQETITAFGNDFAAYQKALSESVLSGTNLNELITPINTLGEKIGQLTNIRFDSSAYSAPTVGGPALTSILDQIERELKNNSAAVQELGSVRLADVVDRLERAAYNGTSSLDYRLVDLGRTETGVAAQVKATGEQLIGEIIPEIKNFQASFETRATSLTIQLNDLVKRMNEAASANLKLTDVLSKTLTGKDYTVKDLAFQIMATDKQLTGGSNVSTQIQSMLSGNAAMPVANAASFADIGTALAAVSSNLGKIAGSEDQLKLGNSVYIIKSAEQLAAEFANTKWTEAFLNNTGNARYTTGTNFGRYADYASPEAGAAGEAAYNSGVYAKFGETKVTLSNTALSSLGKALGYAALVVSVGSMAKTSLDMQKVFTDSVVPTLAESDKEGAQNRAYDMGLTGFDSGIFGGHTASAFLENYADMTKQERLFWGSLMSQKKQEFNMAGPTDYDILKNALGDGVYTMDPEALKKALEKDQTNLSDKEVLQKAMADGIDNSNLAKLTDYIVTSGDTSSEIAKAFYKKYGAYVDEVVKPAYGIDENWKTAINAIIEGADNNSEIKAVLDMIGGNITSADDVSLQFKGVFDEIIQQLEDASEARVLPELDAQKANNTATNNPIEGDYSRVLSGLDFSGLSDTIKTQLGDTLGISFENLAGDLSKLSIDSEKLQDNILGWTEKLPETISLDGSTISTQDAKILAQAGIQINGDGTVTFMKAMNENTTGTERNTTLTISDVSDDVITKLNKSGLSFDLSGTVAKLDLSLATVSKNMQSAMYKLNTDLTGQVSDTAKTALSGLGTVLDSGYFQITNQAVLSGRMTISEYIGSMGATAKLVQPEILTALEGIDDVIAQGGEATRQTVAEWADGIVMPSPIKAADINDEMTAAFAAIGITFETQGNEFMMVVNRVGNQLSDGMTLIPQATWDKLNDGIKDALQKLGVSMVTEAGYVKVDISDAMCKIITPEDITPSLQTAMGELGLAFKAEGDKVTLISSTTGENIANGMYTLPTAIYDKLSPDTIAALEALHVGIVTKGTETMLNFKNVMEGGVGDVIELFANRPDLWDQIPKIVVDKLAEAGISVKNGMIDISTQELNGLVNIDTQWYGYWSTMPQDVIDAMGAAKLQTSDGLMQIEKITESTKIPADINTYIKKPFDELPAEIQDRLTGGDDSVKKSLQGSEVLITGATKDAFVGAVQAVHDNFTNMNTEADAGAQQLANTISNALASVQKLSNIKVGASWRPFEDTTKAAISGSPGNYTVRYGSNKYSGIMAQSEKEAVKMVERLTGIDIPGYAAGGIISTDGLYRAGEFGAKEGIIPLENQSALKLVGSAIAGQMPSNSSGTMYLGGIDSTALKSLYSAFESFPRINAEAIRGAVVALTAQQEKLPEKPLSLITSIQGTLVNLSDFNKTTFADLPMSLADIKTAIDSASSAIQSSTANISVSSSFGSTLGSTASADYSGVMAPVEERLGVDMSWDDVVDYVNNKAQYANADDATKLSLQAANQAIRDAYSINEDVFSYDDLMGSASGSLVTKDALYRAGEFGLNEAIIPIERPDVMSKIGQAIVNSMPVEFTELLKSAVGMKNAGVVTPTTTINYQPTQDTASIVEAITQKVLENVLPAMGGTNQEVPTPIYVGTLIADDAGLRELNKKMRIVELRETARRS